MVAYGEEEGKVISDIDYEVCYAVGFTTVHFCHICGGGGGGVCKVCASTRRSSSSRNLCQNAVQYTMHDFVFYSKITSASATLFLYVFASGWSEGVRPSVCNSLHV
jgi:hypothetical protein